MRSNSETFRLSVRATMASVAVLAIPAGAQAAFTPPAGLPAGSSYVLAFVSSDSVTGVSSSISTYNTLASTDAATNTSLPVTTWKAIASVSGGVNALTNINESAIANDPVYEVDGTEVATSVANLFSGVLLTGIGEDEFGNSVFNYVWTGSNNDGTAASGAALGSTQPVYGAGDDSYFPFDFGSGSQTLARPVYAISAAIPASAPIPEPASGGLVLLGGLATAWLRRRTRR